MTVAEEKPAGGGDWLNNGFVFEQARMRCLELAEQFDREDKSADAARMRELAETARKQRDRAHADGLRRQLDRSIGARRRY